MPEKEVLTPSENGKDCIHNGENSDYECCCDECDYYLECFPDYEEKPSSITENGF